MSFEREVAANLGVRVTTLDQKTRTTTGRRTCCDRTKSYNVPITRPDPGPDGVAGNTDDPAGSITYYEILKALAGQAFQLVTWLTDPNADQNFKSIELATSRRFVGGWQFSVSFTATKRGMCRFISGLTPSSNNSAVQAGAFNPERGRSSRMTTRGNRPRRRPARAASRGGCWRRLNVRDRSGTPWARQVRFTGGRTIPTISLNVEPDWHPSHGTPST